MEELNQQESQPHSELYKYCLDVFKHLARYETKKKTVINLLFWKYQIEYVDSYFLTEAYHAYITILAKCESKKASYFLYENTALNHMTNLLMHFEDVYYEFKYSETCFKFLTPKRSVDLVKDVLNWIDKKNDK